MSDLEYQRMMKGKLMKNTTVHADKGRLSTSVGFCFFAEKPEDAIHWLSFNVSTDWLVTFDIPKQLLTESRAHYRDPEHDSFATPATIWRKEYCLQEYSLTNVRVIGATQQWKYYAEKMKQEVVEALGPLGQLLIDTFC